ncbi:uncharacterized protein T551_01137 [Pneumocystis jirovecii RU7]|uniref:Thioesterase domain-containing protein n=1 Tax=Pneumocystis jirovecii (strain RU7) TaxID=1408657 RepID=A0A0W4ZU77_PNEJ7|nr:uncharacterized protein T551_01137 [Pneumocystis jirovecii RU7]KTW31876.1 hypothetical protein T551_01137 [Pneumocystis jirovecii RU7]
MIEILSISSISLFLGYKFNDILRSLKKDNQIPLEICERNDEVENYIEKHPLVQSLRSDSSFSESRPHLNVSLKQKSNNFTLGVLSGKGKISVAPYCFYDESTKRIIVILHLGPQICGYNNIIHGGLLATLIDESFARCVYLASDRIHVTANLNINYRSPAKANQYYVLKATISKTEGRKTWVNGHIEPLDSYSIFGNKLNNSVVIAEATALFIEPKYSSFIKV